MPGGTATATTLDLVPAEILAYARVCAMRERSARPSTLPHQWIRPMLDGAIASFRETGNRRGEGRALLQLATFLDFSNDDEPDILRAALGALEAATEAGDALTIAQAQNRVGVTHQRAGRDDEAGAQFLRALRRDLGFLQSARVPALQPTPMGRCRSLLRTQRVGYRLDCRRFPISTRGHFNAHRRFSAGTRAPRTTCRRDCHRKSSAMVCTGAPAWRRASGATGRQSCLCEAVVRKLAPGRSLAKSGGCGVGTCQIGIGQK